MAAMTEEQNIATPLWKDRIRDSDNPNGAGRQTKISWDSSVLKYVKPYTHKIGWKTTIICREIISALRLMADRHEEVQRVIEVWDGFTERERGKIFSIDKACGIAQADRDEFAGLILAAMKKHVERTGIAIIDQNFEKIIQAACDHAITGGPAGARERVELIKVLTRNTRVPKAETPVRPSNDAPVATDTTQAKSLDAQMAEIDAMED